MKRSALLGVGALATALAGGGMAMGATQATGKLHILHVQTHRLQVSNTSRTTFAETSAVRKAGKKVGYETSSCNDGGTNVKCSMSMSLPNGMLLGYITTPITTSDKTTLTGRVTDGLGKYAGVTGTIKADVNGKNSSYTITYHS